MTKRFVFILLLALWAFKPIAQKAEFTPLMQAGLADIAHLRYTDLKDKLTRERVLNKGNRVPDYLEAAALCIELFVNENEAVYDKREPELNALMRRLEQLPEDEPFKRVFLGEIYLAKASLQGKFNNRIQALWLFNKAYNLLQENYQRYPNFAPNFVPWGVLNAAIGSLPDDYKSIAGVLGFKGNIGKGLDLVREGYYACLASSEYSFYKPYFGFIYCYINFQLEGSEDLDLYKLGLPVEQSSFYIYLQSRILLSNGKSQNALKILENRPNGVRFLDFHYLHYLTGKIALTVNRSKAPRHLRLYLKNTHNRNYFKSTYRFLAWYHLLNNQADSADFYRQKIMEPGKNFVGADEQAEVEAERGFNKRLIEARLLFDGGFYPQVIQLLNLENMANCCQKPWEQAEFHYRLGRAFQELALRNKAVAAYKKALLIPLKAPTYALGNSALQLAAILEASGQAVESKKYYQLALEHSGYPFYESIHQKAKTALNRLD
jgi:hypothetical protein